MRDTLHILRAAAVVAPSEAGMTALLEARRDALPRAQGRRMSPLGLALDLALDGEAVGYDEPVVYASRYAMSRALEDYLTSFPHPSPLAFQNAIHPAGIEQYLVPRKAAVRELVPVAIDAYAGLAPALRALFLTPGATRRLVGGEEGATWLAVHEAAADRTFAFALALSTEPSPESLGTLTRERDTEDNITLSAATFADAVARRVPATSALPGFGRFTLAWL